MNDSPEFSPPPERPFLEHRFDFGNIFERFNGHQPTRLDSGSLLVMTNKVTKDGLTPIEVEQELALSVDFSERLFHLGQKDRREEIKLAYRALFDREVDEEGYQTYKPEARKSREMIKQLTSSDEWTERAVREMYRFLLARDPDQGGLEHYQPMARSGDLASIRKSIKESDEYKEVQRLREQNQTPIVGAYVQNGVVNFTDRLL